MPRIERRLNRALGDQSEELRRLWHQSRQNYCVGDKSTKHLGRQPKVEWRRLGNQGRDAAATVSARNGCPVGVIGWTWIGNRGPVDRPLARGWPANSGLAPPVQASQRLLLPNCSRGLASSHQVDCSPKGLRLRAAERPPLKSSVGAAYSGTGWPDARRRTTGLRVLV